MKINTKNKTKDHDLTFKCSCRYPHFVNFCYSDDPDWDEFSVEAIDASDGLWQRIKNCWRHIFKGGKFYSAGILLEPEDVKKLIQFIQNYLMKHDI